MTRRQALELCTVGPTSRASGLEMDVRLDAPYAAYGDLDFGRRNGNLVKVGLIGIADAGQHIRDGIRHHNDLLLCLRSFYQLDLITPGISPCSASLRRQIRHMSNLR